MSGGIGKRSSASVLARWSVVATVLTFLLIILGGVVRVSDSGLGCGPAGSGTQGWPLCDGRLLPLLDSGTLTEYSHRLLAGLVAVAAVFLLVFVWRRLRNNRPALILAGLALFSVLIQAVLGGLTVEDNLNESLVAAHLGLAMLLLAIFMGMRKVTAVRDDSSIGSGIFLKFVTAFALVAVLGTIVAGGYVAGTEGHGRASFVKGTGAHLACGKEFPSCQGAFLPFGRSKPVDIHLVHRAFMYVASALILMLFVIAAVVSRYRKLFPMAALGLVLLVLQVLLGALNVWVGEKGWLVIAHLAMGTVLWIWIVQFALNLLPAHREAPAKAAAGEQAHAIPTQDLT